MMPNMGELINFPTRLRTVEMSADHEATAQVYQLIPQEQMVADELSISEYSTADRLHAHARILENMDANNHPVVLTSRGFLTSEKNMGDLGAIMAGALPAAYYLKNKYKLPLTDTLDELNQQFSHNKVPKTYEELKKYWTQLYVHGTGVYHLEKLTDDISDDEVDHSSVHHDISQAMSLLDSHPAAFLNCLAAADACLTSEYLTEQESRDLLKILGSQHIAERPFATWYLMSLTAKYDDPVYLKPLLATIANVEVGVHSTKYDARTTPLLTNINESVKYAVRSKWNQLGAKAHNFYQHDFGGYIDGTLSYDDTVLANDPAKPNYDRFRRSDRELKALRSNLSSMTVQLVRYVKIQPIK